MPLNVISERVILGNSNIIFDPQLLDKPFIELFSAEFLHHQKLSSAIACGRGEVVFFNFQGQEWVLRHYRRGGLMARFSSDRFIGLKAETSRSWKEWQLLLYMNKLGLPVPRPVAAHTMVKLYTYTADLITVRIPGSSPLAAILQIRQIEKELWFAIGVCLRQFHDCGVFHSDLNAKNILIDQNNKVYLIDFDRCSMKKSAWWKKYNLARLKRSLDKFLAGSAQFNFHSTDWDALCEGYDQP
ncbi:3-deoxy-D-manno-octulosonic acid kinase [Pelovirga terrestris]|uniref:3-deoxy-D-manno-octulosonic acid kinase n=1 Tax=Pelovirga terrestris TaxID=2771352 RepID=A0A8J6R656_9BACT|nr:3-deoxy-D-manno-octulosonic acid kinase [Pelovirga terrestris]MBD1401019.1 3-deoxy-D-manno-octulosonic acid kinase [Pelovirga terrestris]